MNAIFPHVHLAFTGYESDRFVRFANRLRKSKITPFVEVIGREPITTTNINFQGEVIQEVWDGYRRFLVVKTNTGVVYQVGGTNATRPIASKTVSFLNVPRDFLGPLFSLSLDELLVRFADKPQSSDITDVIKYNIRLNMYDSDERQKIINKLLNFVNLEDNETRRNITEVLGLTDSPLVLEPMSLLLEDIDKKVRIEASLRFRGLEPVVKSVGEESDLGKKCITALINALSDGEDEVRIYAAEDLGYFYNQNAIEALVHSLEYDNHEHVRWAAAIALGRTNNEDVAKYLATALNKDNSSYVQQGIILGLGRIGSRIPQTDLRDSLLDNLKNKLSFGEPAIQDYASYAIGEVGLHSLKSVESLLIRLQPENPFQVKSSVILSLTKLISLYLDQQEIIQVIGNNLRENLRIQRPDEWPSSAYYQWFQSGAAELSALLELHEIAYKYYNSASSAFATMPWLSDYYEAIGNYEYAEYLCSQGELYFARETLLKSISLFENVEKSSDFLAESEKTISGLQFKVVLARARINLLDAIIRWEVPVLREQDYVDIQGFFNQAVNQYRRIDLTGLTTDGKKLTRAEENLVLGLMLLAEIGYNLIKLDLLIVNLDEQKLRLGLGSLRNQIKRIGEVAAQSRSQSLKEMSAVLIGVMQESYTLDSLTPITEVVGNLISHAKRAFSNSLPTPGNCPIIDFGSANMTINLRGSISGDGTQEHPFVFPSNRRIVFEITVSVLKRTKNDRLIFMAVNPPATVKDTTQEIPVYESQYTLRPLDYGLLAPGIVATQYDFVLLFQNQGCSQPIHSPSVWVRTYDAEREFTTKSSRRKEKMEFLHRHIDELRKNLVDLRNLGINPESGGENINERIRKLEINLQTKIKELDELDHEDIDFEKQAPK